VGSRKLRYRRVATRRRGIACVGVVGLGCLIWGAHSSLTIYRVTSASMEPTLHCAAGPGCRGLRADIVVVSRISRITSVERGDIVAFKTPDARCRESGVQLKRVIGLPGDILRTQGAVPANEYFVLSDNPRGACDSRQIGPIPKRALVGKVVWVYSP
jgi:signal peptidase I